MRVLAPLSHRDFRLLFIGQTVSMFGNQLYSVALPFQILAIKGSPIQLGTGYALFGAAQLATVLAGGALVDRFSRRRVILMLDLVSAVVVGVVAALGLAHRLEIWHIYVLSSFFGATASFYSPAMNAIMPELVPPDILVPGNALRGLSRQSSRALGPLTGGLIVGSVGAPWAFAVDAGTFAISFLVFRLSTVPAAEPPAPKSLVAQVREGLTFTFSVPWLRVSILGFALVNLFYIAGFSVALPILVLKVLKGTATTYGVIGAAGAVGEIVGGLIVGNVRFKRIGLAVYVFNALLGLAFAVYGLAPLIIVVLIGAFAFSLTIVAANTLWDSALQRNVPRQLIGRVTSVDSFGSYLAGPVAPILGAAVISDLGPSVIFVFGGVVSFTIWLLGVAVIREVRQLRST